MVTTSSVSVVATVKNEAETLHDWLIGIEGQSLRPVEVIVVDGGSTDGTLDVLYAWHDRLPLRVVTLNGAGISAGRNAALHLANCDIVAITDAGTVASRDWLGQIVAPFDDPGVDVVAGFFVPKLCSPWERALAATTLPDAREINGRAFLPSSRSVAIRRTWFEAGVRYPEWLDYCEDVVFDLALRRAGARFEFAPDAQVEFRVRPSLRDYALQYFRYARGDGKAGLFAWRHAIRYAMYGALILVLRRRRGFEYAALAVAGMLYLRKPVERLLRRDYAHGVPFVSTLALVPLIAALRAVGDVAKMVGYPFGLAWRLRKFGTLGWRTSWRRITPGGDVYHPGPQSKGGPWRKASLDAGSQQDSPSPSAPAR